MVQPQSVFQPEHISAAFSHVIFVNGAAVVDDCCGGDEHEHDHDACAQLRVERRQRRMILSWLIEPLQYGFMQRGLFAALIIGILCAVIGCYVVLRSMAFLGDALAHAILPGVAVAYLLGGSLLVGALVAASHRRLEHRFLQPRRGQSAKIPPSASCSPRPCRWAWH